MIGFVVVHVRQRTARNGVCKSKSAEPILSLVVLSPSWVTFYTVGKRRRVPCVPSMKCCVVFVMFTHILGYWKWSPGEGITILYLGDLKDSTRVPMMIVGTN